MRENKARLWTRDFILVIGFSFFSNAAALMTYPLVAKYSLTLDPDLTLASTIAGLMSLMSLFVCPFAGMLSDRFSRKRILQASSLCYAAVMALHALADTIPVLIALRILVGVFFSINCVTAVTFSTEFIPQERMGEGLGYVGLAGILASAVGPGLGLRLADLGGYPATFLGAAAAILLCLLLVTVLPGKEPEVKTGERKRVRFSDLMAVEYTGFMLLSALLSAGSALITTYLPILGEERGIGNVAAYFTVHSVAMVALRPFTGKLLDRKGVGFIAVPAVLFAAVGLGLVGSGYRLWILLVAAVFVALGIGEGVPALQSSIIKELGSSRTGAATSTVQIGQNIGNALAPMMSSFFIESFGYGKTFWGFGILLCVCGWLILYLHSRKRASA